MLPVFALVTCAAATNTFSQASLDTALKNSINVFSAALGNQSPVYNGIQYVRYPNFIHTGHPFFVADSMVNGSVTFEGVTYNNIPLLLDESKDQLITTDLQGDNLVQLFKNSITTFNIGSDSFINTSISGGASAYYRLLYNGRSQVLTKENKLIQVRTGRTKEETERWVSTSTDYYLKTKTGYQKFNRLSSFLSLFGKDENQVAQYIRENRLRTKAEREDLYIRAAKYYDQLTD
jgi:hypothetical protein